MKKLIIISVVSFYAYISNAQVTNSIPNYVPPTDWYQMALQEFETSTNFVIVGGYGHTLQGIGKNVVFGEVGYNFNNYAGIIAGYDYLWGNHQHEFNSVKGGLALQAPFHPFGITNIVLSPTVFDQVATSSSSIVANIVGAGLDAKFNLSTTLWLHTGIDYEKRTGDSVWDGEYGLIHLALSGNF